MDQRQYNNLRNQYQKGERSSSLSYRSNRNRFGNSRKKEEDYLPYSAFFRLRVILCIVVFLSFLFADQFVLKEQETARIYQALQENTTGEGWKAYVTEAFTEISETK